MKQYKAVFEIKDRLNHTLFDELEHYITIHDDGTILESHYVSHIMGAPKTHVFTTPRVWDKSFLEDYILEEI
jgi:hypothetical protein